MIQRVVRWLRQRGYFMADLFTEEERAMNLRLVTAMDRYIHFFLPQRDGYLLRDLVASGMDVARAEQLVFDNDERAMKESVVGVAVYRGRVDPGVAFERGYFYRAGVENVALRVDGILPLPTGENPMLKRSLTYKRVFATEEELMAWARRFHRAYMARLVTSLAAVACVIGAGAWLIIAY